jgi:hypothetical protein
MGSGLYSLGYNETATDYGRYGNGNVSEVKSLFSCYPQYCIIQISKFSCLLKRIVFGKFGDSNFIWSNQ